MAELYPGADFQTENRMLDRWKVGSMCHCGDPDGCDDHWMIETVPVKGQPAFVHSVIANNMWSKAEAEHIVMLHNKSLGGEYV